MLKEERLNSITELVNKKGVVNVNELIAMLQVSDMTVRRDLADLEKKGALRRIHGGAQSLKPYRRELSHEEKLILNPEQKKEIATKAMQLITERDTIFLGPGTTIELLAQALQFDHLRIVTNSLPVFTILKKEHPDYQLYLAGGEYRKLTGAFFGDMTNKILQDITFSKAFIGANAVTDNRIMTATIEEGTTQKIVLDNSQERYLLVDRSKLNSEDFYTFYPLDQMTGVVTNSQVGEANNITDEDITVF